MRNLEFTFLPSRGKALHIDTPGLASPESLSGHNQQRFGMTDPLDDGQVQTYNYAEMWTRYVRGVRNEALLQQEYSKDDELTFQTILLPF
jgi:hypothetical protein